MARARGVSIASAAPCRCILTINSSWSTNNDIIHTMSSSTNPNTLQVDDSMDAKTQIATKMLRSLFEDHLLQIALDHHDGARRKRRAKEAAQGESQGQQAGIVDSSEEADATMEDGEVKESAAPPPTSLAPPTNNSRSTPSASSTPVPPSSTTKSGTSTSSAALYASNPLLECLACRRHVSSNRYAPHLAKCMGLGTVGTGSGGGKGHGGGSGSGGGLKRKATVSAAMAKQRGRPSKGPGMARSTTGTPVPGL